MSATSGKTQSLASFLRDRGAHVHSSLELFAKSTAQRERGVVAMDVIKRGDTLLSLPRSAVLCACENGSGREIAGEPAVHGHGAGKPEPTKLVVHGHGGPKQGGCHSRTHRSRVRTAAWASRHSRTGRR